MTCTSSIAWARGASCSRMDAWWTDADRTQHLARPACPDLDGLARAHRAAPGRDHNGQGGLRARARAAALLQRAAAKHPGRDGRLESGVRALGVSREKGRNGA